MPPTLARFRTRRRDDPAASRPSTRWQRNLAGGVLRASLESGVKRRTASRRNGLDVNWPVVPYSTRRRDCRGLWSVD